MESISKKSKVAIGVGAAALLGAGLLYYFKTGKTVKAVKHVDYEDPSYMKNVPLTKSEAERRKQLVSDVHYDVALALLKGISNTFNLI